ncbi:hypothetical protein D9613_002921 [Agrocybe pediades]|uniref:Zinc-ribbon 15 domain-containing protein n=1 Tax=Agrocybe pediades TaxID=84607 RepID=A0A8H4QSF3_9AGAR|nr:hypothetical protein D9613_002921 [Agrocybe pediades]
MPVGCPTTIKQEGDGSPRQCPRCHNAAVVQAKRSTWFELFWIPLIPLSRKHVLLCSICQWSEEAPKHVELGLVDDMKPKSPPDYTQSAQYWEPPNHPGYQPAYVYAVPVSQVPKYEKDI